ncbi:MAG: hypothetical protein ACI4WZ_03840 [Eubacteriales bacterium]
MIVRPFNLPHIALLLLAAGCIILLPYFFRDWTEKKRKAILVGLCLLNILAFFLYKICLSKDTEFLSVSGIDRFNWFNELPLQLCNINMFLIPIGLLTNRRSLLGFSFYIAPLGAVMALLFPEPAFSGYSLLTPRIFGFYFTHLLILICSISLATLRLYRPKLTDLPGILLTLLCIAFAAFGCNLILRATVCPFANYFFTFPADISILNLFWSWLPVPFLYLLPAIGILLAYMALISFLFYLPGLVRKHKEKDSAVC